LERAGRRHGLVRRRQRNSEYMPKNDADYSERAIDSTEAYVAYLQCDGADGQTLETRTIATSDRIVPM